MKFHDMRLFAAMVVSGVGVSSLFADTCVWTGGGVSDGVGAWTNAANWAGGAVPGRYRDAGGAIVGEFGATVSFPIDDTDVTVDLDGMYSVCTVLVTRASGAAGTGLTTFGLSAAQTLTFEDEGYLALDATVATVPAFTATTGQYMPTDTHSTCAFVNNSGKTLVFNDLFRKVGPTSGWRSLGLTLTGNADIRFDGKSQMPIGLTVKLNPGKLVINSEEFYTTELQLTSYDAEKPTILIPAGKKARMMSYTGFSVCGNSSGKTIRISGDGQFDFTSGASGKIWNNAQSRTGQTIIFETAHLGGYMTYEEYAYGRQVGFRTCASANNPNSWNTGYYVFASPDNQLRGEIENYSSTALQSDSFGLVGAQGGFGWCTNFYVCNRARFVYTGAGETTDRKFHIGRHPNAISSDVQLYRAAFELINSGTGAFNVDSTLDYAESDITASALTLSGDSSAPAAWRGDLTLAGLSVIKNGTGLWTLSGDNAYSGATILSNGTLCVTKAASLAQTAGIWLEKGTLKLTEENATLSLPKLVATGNATLVLARGLTLNVAELSVTSGKTLDILADDSVTFRVTGATAGPATGVTINGSRAHFTAEGCLTTDGTGWKRAESGAWGTADNWTDGVPSATQDGRIMVGGTYAVRVDEPAAVTNFTVYNLSGTTTLAISNTFDLAANKANIQFLQGADVRVGAGGAFNVSADLASWSLRNGASFTVDGGTATVEVPASTRFGSDDPALTGVVRVASGTMTVKRRTDTSYSLVLDRGARLDVSGGTLTVENRSWNGSPFQLQGGMTHVVSGDGRLSIPECQQTSLYLDGTLLFKDRAVFHSTMSHSGLIIAPLKANGLAELLFTDESRIEGSTVETMMLMMGVPGVAQSLTDVSIRLIFDTAATNVFRGLILGSERSSVCEAELRRGTLSLGCGGILLAGTWEGYYTAGGRINATFRMKDGVVTANGHNYEGATVMRGLVIGEGLNDSRSTDYHYRARFEMDGGAYTNLNGFVAMGVGRAEGTLVQRGGLMSIGATWSAQTPLEESSSAHPALYLVGGMTGTGLWTVSNGVTLCDAPAQCLYVGGAGLTTVRNAFYSNKRGTERQAWIENCLKNAVTTTLAATGTLEVVDGTFTTRGDAVVGADGRGEIRLVGSAGAFQCRNLVLSNRVASVLSYVFDAQGVKPLQATGAVTVTDGATLEVDVGAYVGEKGRHRLVSAAGGIEGSFLDPSRVTFLNVGPATRGARLVQREGALDVLFARGISIILR